MPRISELNLFVCLLLSMAAAMLVPAILSFEDGGTVVAKSFLMAASISFILAILLALALLDRAPRLTARAHIVTVFAAYIVLPAFCALPLVGTVPGLNLSEAYFEMVSALTTTGLTGIAWEDLPRAIIFWRIFVGWLGGFLILLAGFSIMAPLQIGGFEVESTSYGRIGIGATHLHGDRSHTSGQMLRHAQVIGPFYLAATLFLAALLSAFGDTTFVAITHAMAILSTSGMSPIGGLAQTQSGYLGEVAMIVFLILAVSHRMFSDQLRRGSHRPLARDMEIRLAVTLIISVTLLLFLGNYIGAVGAGQENQLVQAFSALWGILFTTLSYLTTTGFESRAWAPTEAWSGVAAPQLLLMTLVIIGGGIATTAGGVKLLRVYALYKHGMREMERLVHPSSVGGYGSFARTIRREGAYIAWMFVMIFLLSIGLGMLALGFNGYDLKKAMIMTVAALGNCGPLAAEVMPTHEDAPANTLTIMNTLMILGRMEALAVIAILNPEFWRR